MLGSSDRSRMIFKLVMSGLHSNTVTTGNVAVSDCFSEIVKHEFITSQHVNAQLSHNRYLKLICISSLVFC